MHSLTIVLEYDEIVYVAFVYSYLWILKTDENQYQHVYRYVHFGSLDDNL